MSTHPRTVLLVDDEADLRSMTREMLELVGFGVIEAADGEQALEALGRAESLVDLVLIDYDLPGMDGLETIQRLRGMRPGLAAYLLTGFMNDDLPREGLARVEAVINKPFGLAELRRKLGWAA